MVRLTLKDARGLVGITQVELDRRAGLQRGTTNDIEAGRNARPAHDTVTKIVRVIQRAGLAAVTSEVLFPVDAPTEQEQGS